MKHTLHIEKMKKEKSQVRKSTCTRWEWLMNEMEKVCLFYACGTHVTCSVNVEKETHPLRRLFFSFCFKVNLAKRFSQRIQGLPPHTYNIMVSSVFFAGRVFCFLFHHCAVIVAITLLFCYANIFMAQSKEMKNKMKA